MRLSETIIPVSYTFSFFFFPFVWVVTDISLFCPSSQVLPPGVGAVG